MKKYAAYVLMVALTACGEQKKQAAVGFPQDSPKEGELSVWVRTQAVVPAFEAFNAKMKKEGRNVSVKVNVVTSDDFVPAFASALAANQPVDLVSVDLVMAPSFSSKDSFLDITALYNELPYKDQLNPGMAALGMHEGKVFAVPNANDASALLYNRKIFKQAGITNPPANWEEFRAAAKKVSQIGKLGYVFSGADAGGMMFTLMPWVWANGGEWLSTDGKKSKLDSPQTQEFMQLLVDMINDGSIPEGVTSYSWTDYQTAFQQERVAMVGGGSFWIKPFRDAGLDFGVVPFFSKDGSKVSTFTGGDLLAIPRTSRFPHLAWEVIQFMLSEEVQVGVHAKNGNIPVRKDFFDNQYFREEPRFKVIADATPFGQVPYTAKYFELYNPFQTGIQKILTRQSSPADALAETDAAMQKVIDRPTQSK